MFEIKFKLSKLVNSVSESMKKQKTKQTNKKITNKKKMKKSEKKKSKSVKSLRYMDNFFPD